ncbi:S24/S26 family peptidase [Pedococcus sp. KACC 23699]|uniref:S24/S26 family peptidase n=1 Tax=Pedococcus sp. KACC 23699 TaxID=3149228 RepID=A0AAU7JRI2_9MICO
MPLALGLVVVKGRSMEPTLHTGDRMVVLKGAPPRLGRLAIVRLPPDDDGAPRPLAVKRVTMRDPADPARYWVESDNQGLFGVADSWTHGIGSLAREQIRALVLFRIPHRIRVPKGRRGRRATTGNAG